MNKKITEKEFLAEGYSILEQDKELMIFIRYPNQAGNRAFILMKSKIIFSAFLENCKNGDSIAIIHSIEKVVQGKVTNLFIQEAIFEIEQYDYVNWVFAWLLVDLQEFRKINYYEVEYITDRTDLIEILEEFRGKEIEIVKEPDGFDEERTTHIYKGGFPLGAY